jgi:excisionase family DNA binding protein
MDGMIDVREIAGRLSVSVSTVRRLIRNGSLQAVRVGRQWRVAESWIDSLINFNLRREKDDQSV